MNKKILAIIIAITLVVILIGTVCYGVVKKEITKIENPIATITIEGYETPIIVELYPEYAPNTVTNFIKLANNGFYNGLKIHRVEDYVIQGGDPNGNGSGGPTLSSIDSSIEKGSDADKQYSINGEFSDNGYDKNTLAHEKGVISMARNDYGSASDSLTDEGYNSAGSQFFICLKYMPYFNGKYSAFGRVTSGMETVDAISQVELKVEKDEETGTETQTSEPKDDIIITSITVDTKGVDYGMPKVHEAFDYTSWYLQRLYGTQS